MSSRTNVSFSRLLDVIVFTAWLCTPAAVLVVYRAVL